MKATFALLANHKIHNVVRKLTWEIHQKFRAGTQHASLPPHISLKQPFSIPDLKTLESYMDDFAGSIEPFEVTLTELQVVPVPLGRGEYGVLWFEIEETETLRSLHNRLNHELNARFGDASADFDGDDYRFHMSVIMGGQLMDIYKKFREDIPNGRVDLSYTPSELAMFVYDEPRKPHSDYLCYRVLPLGRT